MTVIDMDNGSAERNTFLLYKCKYNVAFVNFQEGCLLYQKKFKIPYAQMQEITSLKFHFINIRFN
jgi:hypothetical protein